MLSGLAALLDVAQFVHRLPVGRVERQAPTVHRLGFVQPSQFDEHESLAAQRPAQLRVLVFLVHGFLRHCSGCVPQPDDDAFKGATYAILHKQQADAAKGKEVLTFFDYAFKNGAAATELDYVPMPEGVGKLIERAWKSKLKNASGKSIW